MDTVEALEKVQEFEVAAGEIGSSRQAVEVIDVKRGGVICTEESVVGVTPRATFVTLTCAFKIIHLKPTLGRNRAPAFRSLPRFQRAVAARQRALAVPNRAAGIGAHELVATVWRELPIPISLA